MAKDFDQEKSRAAEEIRALEHALEEKKRALVDAQQETSHEKELLREALREHIGAMRPPVTSVPLPATPFGSDDGVRPAPISQDHAQEEEVRALINIALTRSIEDAVKAAQERSPYLLDELHDYLVDEYYEKLIALRKVSP